MIKTILFDLDDTIFDHKQEILLSGNYLKVLDRTLSLKDSMIERTNVTGKLFLK